MSDVGQTQDLDSFSAIAGDGSASLQRRRGLTFRPNASSTSRLNDRVLASHPSAKDSEEQQKKNRLGLIGLMGRSPSPGGGSEAGFPAASAAALTAASAMSRTSTIMRGEPCCSCGRGCLRPMKRTTPQRPMNPTSDDDFCEACDNALDDGFPLLNKSVYIEQCREGTISEHIKKDVSGAALVWNKEELLASLEESAEANVELGAYIETVFWLVTRKNLSDFEQLRGRKVPKKLQDIFKK